MFFLCLLLNSGDIDFRAEIVLGKILQKKKWRYKLMAFSNLVISYMFCLHSCSYTRRLSVLSVNNTFILSCSSFGKLTRFVIAGDQVTSSLRKFTGAASK